jgi:hypothetical protein
MLTQLMALPPAVVKIATTPVLASERPAGFTHVKVVRLPADARLRTLGAVRLDFSNGRTSESASFALMRTQSDAARLARTEANANYGGRFHVAATAIGRFAVAVTAKRAADARTMLAQAIAHLRRSER